MRSDIYILRPCHGNANASEQQALEVNDSQAQWHGVNGNSYTLRNQPSNSQLV